MSSVGGKPSSGSTTECPSRRPCQAASSSIPSRQAFIWSRQVAANTAVRSSARIAASQGCSSCCELVGGSLDRLGQVGKAVRAEALQRETVFDHALGGGQAVTYVVQLGGGRGHVPMPDGSWSAAGRRSRACAQSAGSSTLASRYSSAISAPDSGQVTDGSISIRDVSEVGGVRGEPLTQGGRGCAWRCRWCSCLARGRSRR